MKPLFEPPHVVHFFKSQLQDGAPKSVFYGTFEMAVIPDGRFPICIKDEIFDASMLYLDASSGHYIAHLQFRTMVGCPPRERALQHIAAYQALLSQEPAPEVDGY